MIFFGLGILVILSSKTTLLRLIHRLPTLPFKSHKEREREREREREILDLSDLNFDIFIIILKFQYM